MNLVLEHHSPVGKQFRYGSNFQTRLDQLVPSTDPFSIIITPNSIISYLSLSLSCTFPLSEVNTPHNFDACVTIDSPSR